MRPLLKPSRWKQFVTPECQSDPAGVMFGRVAGGGDGDGNGDGEERGSGFDKGSPRSSAETDYTTAEENSSDPKDGGTDAPPSPPPPPREPDSPAVAEDRDDDEPIDFLRFKDIVTAALKNYTTSCSPEEQAREQLAKEARLREELLTNDLDRIFRMINPLGTARVLREDIAHGLSAREDVHAVLEMSERVVYLLEQEDGDRRTTALWRTWRATFMEWNPEERVTVPNTMNYDEFHAFFAGILHKEWARAAAEQATAEEGTEDTRAKALENDVMYRRSKLAFDLIDSDGNGSLSGREMLEAVNDPKTVAALTVRMCWWWWRRVVNVR